MPFRNLQISKIVLHEVFERTDSGDMVPPKYGTKLTNLPAIALGTFCDRVTDAVGKASKSFKMSILHAGDNSAVAIAKRLLACDDQQFLDCSKTVADMLTHAQVRRKIPGGILVVFTGSAGNPACPILGMIKAETHSGFTVEAAEGDGGLTMKFLEDLFMTPHTRLYKIGVFKEDVRECEDPLPEGWSCYLYDERIVSSQKIRAAQYFYETFLGCGFPLNSAKFTRDFYFNTKDFIQNMPVSQFDKSTLINALVTYLKADQNPTIQVGSFCKTYFAEPETQDSYERYMRQKKFPQEAIIKDLTDLHRNLRYRSIVFENEIKISAPTADFDSLVEMTAVEGDPGEDGIKPKWTQVTIKAEIKSQE